MSTSSGSLNERNKVVVAFLGGRRLKGYIYNFSALKTSFVLFPTDSTREQQGLNVEVKDLKAIFFVRDIVGNPEYHELTNGQPAKHGRRVEVRCGDGETFRGTTDAYNPQKQGFFMFPTDPKSNNTRIFVVIKNVAQIQFA